MPGSTKREDAKINKTDRYFPQEYPSADEIAEQKRIQEEIRAEKIANGPPETPDRRSWPKDRVFKVGMLPGGRGVLRGQL